MVTVADRPDLHVGLVSTYPPAACGIGTYTEALAGALAGVQGARVSVLAEVGGAARASGGVACTPVFDRNDPWHDPIVAAARDQDVDVIHIQHAPDIFGMDDRLPALARALRRDGIAVVVTLHSVYTRASAWLQRKRGVIAFHRALGDACDAIIVHQATGMQDVLIGHRVPASIVKVIHHGTAARSVPPQDRARRELGLPPGGPVLLCFGFVHMLKNLHLAVETTALLRSRFPDVRLLIAGSVQRGVWYNRLYARYLRSQVVRLGLEDHVRLRFEFIDDADVATLHGAADCALLPYSQRYGSASGAAHLALGTGTPMVFSRSPKFAELSAALGPEVCVEDFRADRWARKLEALLGDPRRMEAARTRVSALAAATAWPIVARETVDLYRSLPRGRSVRSQARAAG